MAFVECSDGRLYCTFCGANLLVFDDDAFMMNFHRIMHTIINVAFEYFSGNRNVCEECCIK